MMGTIEFKGDVLCDTASRITLALGDGVTADTTGTAHTGSSKWIELTSGEVTFGANVAQAKATAAISTSADVAIAYIDHLRLLRSDRRVLSYHIPFALDSLESVWMEDSVGRLTIPLRHYTIELGQYPVLRFHNALDLVTDRHLLLQGTRIPAMWTDDSTTVTLTQQQYTALVSNCIADALAAIGADTQLGLSRIQIWRETANTDLARADNSQAGARRLN